MKVYDFERAYVVIQSAIKLIPSREKYVRSEMIGYFNAHYLLGSCLRELGDLQGAIKSLQEADIFANIQHQEIQLFGKPNEVLIPLSKSKIWVLRTVIFKSSYLTSCIQVEIGDCFASIGDKETANEYYLKALKVEPRCPGANFMIGYGLMKDGDFAGAQKYFLEVIEVDANTL